MKPVINAGMIADGSDLITPNAKKNKVLLFIANLMREKRLVCCKSIHGRLNTGGGGRRRKPALVDGKRDGSSVAE